MKKKQIIGLVAVSYTHLDVYKRQSYISVICQAIDFAVEGRKADADTHLAGDVYKRQS